MCKFTNRLFVFAIFGIFYAQIFVEASPCAKKRKKCDGIKELSDDGYDIYIDQRQKGEENYRFGVDGFLIKLREPSTSDLIDMGEILLESVGDLELVTTKNRNKTSAPMRVFNLNSRANQQEEDVPQKKESFLIESQADAQQGLESKFIDGPGTQAKLRIYRLLNLLRKLQEN